MKIILCQIFVMLFAFQTFAQERPHAIKFAEIDDDKESTRVFGDRTQAFIKQLKKSSKQTSGFIAVSGEDYDTLMARIEIAKGFIRKHPDLKRRIEISRPGTKYDHSWRKSELWLIPFGADRPYIPRTSDFYCASLEVTGEAFVNAEMPKLNFTANLSGGDFDEQITYHWTVKGGKIIGGAGTPAITVRAARNVANGISATVNIRGLESSCPSSASFTTILHK